MDQFFIFQVKRKWGQDYKPQREFSLKLCVTLNSINILKA